MAIFIMTFFFIQDSKISLTKKQKYRLKKKPTILIHQFLQIFMKKEKLVKMKANFVNRYEWIRLKILL